MTDLKELAEACRLYLAAWNDPIADATILGSLALKIAALVPPAVARDATEEIRRLEADQRELVQLRALLASALGIPLCANAEMLSAARRMRMDLDIPRSPSHFGTIATLRARAAASEVATARWAKEAFRLADADGWSAFGSHIDQPSMELEFDGKDECGEFLWERPKRGTAPIDRSACCSCPCVDPGSHEQPPEYQPSETCPLHGIVAPHTAFVPASAGDAAAVEWIARALARRNLEQDVQDLVSDEEAAVGWDHLPEADREEFREDARAVLVALKEGQQA